ncbi:MAG TPA: hypothetical protein VIC35_01325 [Acidimicrobiia bacterium]
MTEPPSHEPTPGEGHPDESLEAELEAQHQRISELEAENAALAAARPRRAKKLAKRGARSHRGWVALLLVIGMLLTPITIAALYLKSEITDTGRYVQSVKPLSSNPAIQAYVADDITGALFKQVNISQYVHEALPERAEVLAGPLTSALKGFVHEATLRILATHQFQQLWVDANRLAHAQLVDVLTGNHTSGVTVTSKGAVQINLSSVATLVSTKLQSSGINLFSKIPTDKIGGKVTIFQSTDLYKARQAVGVLNAAAFVLPFLVLAAFGGAIYLSRSRRRGFVLAAVAFTVGALMLALFLAVARGVYLNAATNNQFPYDAAAAMYDTLVRFLHTSVRAVLTFSAIVLIAVLFAGPSRFAVWFRSSMRWCANWLGAESEKAGWDWLAPNALVVRRKKVLRIVVAAIAFLVLFRWHHPTPVTVIWVGVITLALLGLIEFFGREPEPANPDAQLTA